MKDKITLHFAHANGFPSQSYRKMWQFLPDEFDVIAKDKFGHNHEFPVNENWQNQVTELIHLVEEQAQHPIYAVGHSFGGVVSFMACCKRPDLFKGLIMLDPPIMAGPIAPVFRLLKKTPLIDKITPSGKSKFRKSFWSHDEDPLSYFKPKALFKHFDEDCLKDYVQAATEKQEPTEEQASGTRLSFDVDVETRIFRNIPHNINAFKGKLNVSAKLFTAQHTNVCFPRLVKRILNQHNKLQHDVVSGVGHLFPMEKPKLTAGLIAETINEWENTKPAALNEKSE